MIITGDFMTEKCKKGDKGAISLKYWKEIKNCQPRKPVKTTFKNKGKIKIVFSDKS